MSTETQTATTCTNLVERRTGAGITTGAGERSGKRDGLCGKPTPEGQTYCNRCQKTWERRLAKAKAAQEARKARQTRKA